MRIYIKLQGGLGNQLFIYAYARKLQQFYNAEQIIIDSSVYKKYKIRNLDLDKLKLNESVCFKEKYRGKFLFDVTSFIFHVFQTLSLRLFHRYLDFPFLFASKFGFFYAHMKANKIPKVLKKKNIYVYGYFQNLSNFENIENILKQEFDIKDESEFSKDYFKYKKLINSTDSIAISARCGQDYKNCKLNFCDRSYYLRACDLFSKKEGTFFIFSDEISEAKKYFEQLSQNNIVYIPQLSPIEQLMLMKECRHFIVSNSSFSWWGAYLSNNEDKEVIFPDRWFTYYTSEMLNLLFSSYYVIK